MLRLEERCGLLRRLLLLLLLHEAEWVRRGVLRHNEPSWLWLHLRLCECLCHPERGPGHHLHLLLREWIVLSMLLEVGGGRADKKGIRRRCASLSHGCKRTYWSAG